MISLTAVHIRWGLIILSALSFVSLMVPVSVDAQDKTDLCSGANLTFDTTSGGDCNNDAAGNRDCPSGNCAEKSFNTIVATIVNVFSVVVGIAAVIMIIYGGFRYITSGGDSGNISTAKNIILYAIVGLIIVALAQVIVKFILNKVAT